MASADSTGNLANEGTASPQGIAMVTAGALARRCNSQPENRSASGSLVSARSCRAVAQESCVELRTIPWMTTPRLHHAGDDAAESREGKGEEGMANLPVSFDPPHIHRKPYPKGIGFR